MAMAAAATDDGACDAAEGHGTVLSVPMYFKLDANSFQNPESMEKITGIGKICLGELKEPHVELNLGSEFDKLYLFHDIYGRAELEEVQLKEKSQENHLSLRLYCDGLLTLDIQHRKTDSSIQNMASIRALEHELLTHLGDLCTEHNSLYCPIRRGQSVWPYAVSADEHLLEFDYDQLVYETNSKWQNIRIYHSQQLGNALVLDGDSMLGEGDLVYTQTLCRIGDEDYRNKMILVLGGGDGAILHELLKETPQFITMAEIDVEVIKACRKYLRGACGDSLDKLSGKNYKILLEDCTKVLQDSIEKGTSYDFVINDLTEFPVNKSVQGFDYDFGSANLIMELSLKVLKPNGKLLARGNCIGAVSYRTKFEQDVLSLGCLFRRRDIYVPSFHEVYCLYEIWRRDDTPPEPENDSGNQLTGDLSNTGNHSVDVCLANEDIPKHNNINVCTMQDGIIIARKDVSPDNNRMDVISK